jgi:hypothetical protein
MQLTLIISNIHNCFVVICSRNQILLQVAAILLLVLLCLTPDNFTRQVESAATQWVMYILYIYHVVHTPLLKISI